MTSEGRLVSAKELHRLHHLLLPMWTHSAPLSIIRCTSADSLPKSEANTEGEMIALGCDIVIQTEARDRNREQ